MSVGVNEKAYKRTVARLRKAHAHAIWSERLLLFDLSARLEKAIGDALSGLRFNAKPFGRLRGVTLSNGGRYVLFDFWYELKEILEAAEHKPTASVLDRARKARRRLASYSVWK